MGTDTGGSSEASKFGTPTGRFDAAQSAVTGRLLRYFTPDPLLELLRRGAGLPKKQRAVEREAALVMLLIRPAAIHAPTSSFDDRQAVRLGRVALGHLECRASDTLIELGSEISPKVSGLREEIVFAGAGNASDASHVFAPHGVLPSHTERLAEVLNSPPDEVDPAAAASITGFYGAHLHPFLDGNGRWARLLAAYIGARLGSASGGLISAIYQAYFKDELTRDIWPRTRTQGFDSYLDIGSTFEDTLRASLASSNAVLATDEILSSLRSYAPSRRVFERFSIRFFAGDGNVMAVAKEEFGLSSKRMEGLMQRMQRISGDLIPESDDSNLLERLTDDAVRYVREAKDNVLRGFK